MKYSLRSLRIAAYMAALAAFALGLFFGTLLSGLGETASIVVMVCSLLYMMIFACSAIVFAVRLNRSLPTSQASPENPPKK